eukprot:TRINITY_DN3098_c0_g1_i1.p1 TRINITY_DN3098_c0_g1~~TRINITY_DN3098_c0_g1_i1.p1  ORF type:complete len:617 (+),score=211.58 TRINITY_DN3098_c0_g1_i1:48-1853(+)
MEGAVDPSFTSRDDWRPPSSLLALKEQLEQQRSIGTEPVQSRRGWQAPAAAPAAGHARWVSPQARRRSQSPDATQQIAAARPSFPQQPPLSASSRGDVPSVRPASDEPVGLPWQQHRAPPSSYPAGFASAELPERHALVPESSAGTAAPLQYPKRAEAVGKLETFAELQRRRAEDRVSAMEQALEAARRRANELEYKLETRERELQRASERRLAVEESLRVSEARVRDLEGESRRMQQLGQLLADAERRSAELEVQLAKTSQDLTDRLNTATDRASKGEVAEMRADALEKELDTARSLASESQAECEVARQRRDGAEGEAHRLREEMLRHEALSMVAQARLADLERRAQELEARAATAEAARDEAIARMLRAEEEGVAANHRAAAADQNTQQMQQQLAQLTQDTELARQHIEAAQADADRRESAAEGRIQALVAERDEMKQQSDRTAQQMQQAAAEEQLRWRAGQMWQAREADRAAAWAKEADRVQEQLRETRQALVEQTRRADAAEAQLESARAQPAPQPEWRPPPSPFPGDPVQHVDGANFVWSRPDDPGGRAMLAAQADPSAAHLPPGPTPRFVTAAVTPQGAFRPALSPSRQMGPMR